MLCPSALYCMREHTLDHVLYCVGTVLHGLHCYCAVCCCVVSSLALCLLPQVLICWRGFVDLSAMSLLSDTGNPKAGTISPAPRRGRSGTRRDLGGNGSKRGADAEAIPSQPKRAPPTPPSTREWLGPRDGEVATSAALPQPASSQAVAIAGLEPSVVPDSIAPAAPQTAQLAVAVAPAEVAAPSALASSHAESPTHGSTAEAAQVASSAAPPTAAPAEETAAPAEETATPAEEAAPAAVAEAAMDQTAATDVEPTADVEPLADWGPDPPPPQQSDSEPEPAAEAQMPTQENAIFKRSEDLDECNDMLRKIDEHIFKRIHDLDEERDEALEAHSGKDTAL